MLQPADTNDVDAPTGVSTLPSSVAVRLGDARSPSKPDDERLWAVEAAGGSLAAFDRIARAYQGPLMRFLSRRLGDVADAEDVLQETFVCAFRKIGQYDPRWRLSGWMFAIAVRQAATHHRRLRLASSALDTADRADDGAGPLGVAVERDERESLWSVARERLSQEQFDALWLYYVEQLPVADLAHALGRTRVTTKVLLHRARQQLKPHVKALSPDLRERKTS